MSTWITNKQQQKSSALYFKQNSDFYFFLADKACIPYYSRGNHFILSSEKQIVVFYNHGLQLTSQLSCKHRIDLSIHASSLLSKLHGMITGKIFHYGKYMFVGLHWSILWKHFLKKLTRFKLGVGKNKNKKTLQPLTAHL